MNKQVLTFGIVLLGLWLFASLVVLPVLAIERPYSPYKKTRLESTNIPEEPAIKADLGIQAQRYLNPLELLNFRTALLKAQVFESSQAELLPIRIEEWKNSIKMAGASPEDCILPLLPEAGWFQARLISNRDEPSLRDDSGIPGAYGQVYKDIRDWLPKTRASASSFEAIMEQLWLDSGFAKKLDNNPHPPMLKKDRWIPSDKALKASHRYALDIFFTSLSRKDREETGPLIYSMSSGIVVAAADDWSGGDRPSLYNGGGLSPKSGNGAIIYDPANRLYYAYFHMSDVFVKTGQLVAAGESLGHGGNSGVNARKPGHGGHLHIEIHGAEKGPWRSHDIKDYIFSIK